MVLVRPDKESPRVYVTVRDPRDGGRSRHVVVYGTTVEAVAAVIRGLGSGGERASTVASVHEGST